MPKFEITRDVMDAGGTQIYTVEATDIEDAFRLFEAGEGDFISEEIDVTGLSKVDIHDIYEAD